MIGVRFIDLFAGTGGIRLAFEQALATFEAVGICVKSVEIDERACQTYELNFKESPLGDVRLVDEIEPFDVLLAGFPCQAFSYAGKQLGFADTRGTLFFEVERLLEKYRPKLCFLENVRGLTTHDEGKTFKTILEKLYGLGYQVEYRIINASVVGVPQNRTRVYLFASLAEPPQLTIDSDLGASDSHAYKKRPPSLFDDPHPKSLVKDILEDNPARLYDCSSWFREKLEKATRGDLNKLHGVRMIDTRHGSSIHSWDIGKKGECSKGEIEFMNLLVSNRRKHDFGVLQDGKALTLEQIATFYTKRNLVEIVESLLRKGYLKRDKSNRINLVCGNMSFEIFKFLDPDSISITLTASDANRLGVYYNGRIRRLTPRECARLQGYPDDYVLNPSDAFAYKQLGNAVCVPVIRKLFTNLFETTPRLLKSICSCTREEPIRSIEKQPSFSKPLQLVLFEPRSLYVVGKDPVLLLGTYRKACRNWIIEANLYNYPITDTELDSHYEFLAVRKLILKRQNDVPLYFRVVGYSIVTRSALKKLAYPVNKKHSASTKYILYSLERITDVIPPLDENERYIIGKGLPG